MAVQAAMFNRRNKQGLHLNRLNRQIISLESDKPKQGHLYPLDLSKCIEKIPKNMRSSQSSPDCVRPRRSHEPKEDSPTRIQDHKGKSTRNPWQISQSQKFQNKPQLMQAPPENQTAQASKPLTFPPFVQTSTPPSHTRTQIPTTEVMSGLSLAVGVES